MAGMGDIITVQQRNIEELGFPEELHNKADGLFLDLPGPWHVSQRLALFNRRLCFDHPFLKLEHLWQATVNNNNNNHQ